MSDRGKPEHPRPWRWDVVGDGAELVDALGNPIIVDYSGHAGLRPPAPYARQLIREAPEMERLLRLLEWMTKWRLGRCPRCDGLRDYGGHRPQCRLAAFLDRLDAAREESK